VFAKANDLEIFRLPAKEEEPVEEPMSPPAVVRLLVTVREPLNELEPVIPVPMIRPPVVRLPPAWIPRVVMFKLPAKEEEPVPLSVRLPLRTILPPIEALLVSSRLLDTEALEVVKRPTPVILFPAPARAPPKEKPLMVVAVRALMPVILLLPKAKAPERLVAPKFVVPVMVSVPPLVIAAARRPFAISILPA
jgi:hypothetical protein